MDVCLSHKLFLGWNLLVIERIRSEILFSKNCQFLVWEELPPKSQKLRMAKDSWGKVLAAQMTMGTLIHQTAKKKWVKYDLKFIAKISFETWHEAFFQS